MLNFAVVALSCLFLVRTSAAALDQRSSRSHLHNTHNKELGAILSAIDERLRKLDSISAAQNMQAKRLDVIQNKLDRIENTLSLKLERAQLEIERLEHHIEILQNTVQTSIKESTEKLVQSQTKIVEIAHNLTDHIYLHKHLLEKVSGAYTETWRRSLLIESMMRDGLSLINVTRRELADGLLSLARRQRSVKFTSTELEAALARILKDNMYKIDFKMQELLEAQKSYLDSCQRVQQDDPNQVAIVLDKLFDSLINKTASTFHELQNIHVTLRNHDSKVMKVINSGRNLQTDATCRKLETVFKNATQGPFKEMELHQLTEKFVELTNRADATLQKLEARLGDEGPDQQSDITAAADQLLIKLNKIESEKDDDHWDDVEDDSYDDDLETEMTENGGGDMMEEDRNILGAAEPWRIEEKATTQPHHLRHLHKNPYDRGPPSRKHK